MSQSENERNRWAIERADGRDDRLQRLESRYDIDYIPRRRQAPAFPEISFLDSIRHQVSCRRLERAAQAETHVERALTELARARHTRETEERNLVVSRAVWAEGLDIDKALLQKHVEIEQLLVELHEYRARRMRIGTPERPRQAESQPPAITYDITDEEVSLLAEKLAFHVKALPPGEEAGAWEAWREGMQRRNFPPHAVQEVERQAQQILHRLR